MTESVSVIQNPTRNADALQPTDEYHFSRYGFVIGPYHFLTPQSVYCEVISAVTPTPIPFAPNHFSGLINLRGNLIPVYQLESLLGQPKPKSQTLAFILLIGPIENAAAISIAKKPVALQTQHCTEKPMDNEIPEGIRFFCNTAYQHNDTPWLEINHTTLFQHLTSS